MKLTEAVGLIGRTGNYLPTKDIVFQVRALDVKLCYNVVHVLIEPVTGSGTKWVHHDSVAWK
jgi:hypothetical protein